MHNVIVYMPVKTESQTIFERSVLPNDLTWQSAINVFSLEHLYLRPRNLILNKHG